MRLFSPSIMARLTVAAALMFCAFETLAQQYPTRVVRVIVPVAPGGGIDMLARIVGQRLSGALGQPFVIDNRPGAGATIGTALAAKSAPDGHTLLVVPSSISITPSLYKKLPYDAMKDLAPVSILASAPSALLIHPSLPVSTVKDLLTLAKSKPGQLNYASAGNGTHSHLGIEMLQRRAGIDVLHIPYKGIGPAVTDLLSGRASLMISGLPPVLAHIKAGKLKVLAITEARRTSLMPEVPTVAESGFPGYEVENWLGMLAPAGTSPLIVRRLNSELAQIFSDVNLRNQLAAQGYEPVANTPEQFGAVLRADTSKWAKVVRELGIQMD